VPSLLEPGATKSLFCRGRLTATVTSTKTHAQRIVFEEGGLNSKHVRMPVPEASALLRSRFGVHGELKRLPTEKDDTFLVSAADESKFILKVANPAEQTSELEFELRLLMHLEQADSSLPVPRVIAENPAQPYLTIRDHAGQLRHVRLLSYLPGIPLDRTRTTAPERFRIGELLGRLRHATATFSHPADGRILAWDVKHLLDLSSLLTYIEDAGKRADLQLGLQRFAALQARIARLRMQVLHNDFNRSNLIVDHADPRFVMGVIDFGDAVRTAIAIDVATALLNQLPRDASGDPSEDLFAAPRDLLRGYLSVAELTDEEMALVPHLVMARVVARALISSWRAKAFPENADYILRNTEQGWAQLKWFLVQSPDDIGSLLRRM